MIDRKTLRRSAVLLVVGFIFYVVAGLLHPDGPANDHGAVFAEYAGSANWTALPLGQFAGMAVIIAGLLVLQSALDVQAGGATWTARANVVRVQFEQFAKIGSFTPRFGPHRPDDIEPEV